MRSATILVVEDEPLAALEIQECLERMGHRVPEVVDSGDQVLNAVRRHSPDLIVMDINLRSYIDGIDATNRLRMISAAPVVFITAYGTPSVQNRALKTEPAAYLQKPFDETALRTVVERALTEEPHPEVGD